MSVLLSKRLPVYMYSVCILYFLLRSTSAFEIKWNFNLLNRSDDGNWTWPNLERSFKNSIDRVLLPNLAELMEFTATLNLTNSCRTVLIKAALGLRKLEPWVVQMIDATGRLPSGLLSGTAMDLGSFDSCLALRFRIKEGGNLKGRYCMVGFASPLFTEADSSKENTYIETYGRIPPWAADAVEKAAGFMKSLSVWIGVCVPSTCTADDIVTLAAGVAGPTSVSVSVADCQTDDGREIRGYELVSIGILCAIGVLSLVGTAVDVFVFRNRDSTTKISSLEYNILLGILRCFSLVTNIEKLLSGRGKITLSFFGGMRTFSATWVILGHTYFYVDTWKFRKYSHLIGITERFNQQQLPAAAIENFTLPVGSFYFISGFLITYTNWKKMEDTKKGLSLAFFLHKFWRMAPGFVVTLLFLLVLPLIGSGPLWNTTLDPEVELCRKHWWKSLLFISSWWDTDQYCMIHTWFLSTLMQLHVVGFLLLGITFRWHKCGFITGLLVLLSCCAITAVRVAKRGLPMPALGLIKDFGIAKEYNSDVYIKPSAHISSYLIGMLMGYVILKFPEIKLEKVHEVLGWTVATLCGTLTVYGIYGPVDTTILPALYIALHWIGWAIALSWITFICANGRAGVVHRLLSWGALRCFGQLSYMAYLIHPLVLLYKSGVVKERVYYGHSEFVFEYFAILMMSFMLAFVCYITVEVPFASLETFVSTAISGRLSKVYDVSADPPSAFATLTELSHKEAKLANGVERK